MKFKNIMFMAAVSAAVSVSCIRENGVVTLPWPLDEGISFTLSPKTMQVPEIPALFN